MFFSTRNLSIALGITVTAACSPTEQTTGVAKVDAVQEKVSQPGQYSGYSNAAYDGYELTSRYIEMRDATKIAIDILRPTQNGEHASEKLPVVWMHTPYNRRNAQDRLTAENGQALVLAQYGYVVAVADFRGLYASYGRNVGYNRGEWQDAARMDAYDITEWLAAQPWSSGKVGMWGCSAKGGSQMQAITTAPPSLKAVFPMSCEWDIYSYAGFGGMTPEGKPTRIVRGSHEERDENAVPVDGDEDRAMLRTAIAEHQDNIETAGYVPFRDSLAETFDEQWWLKSSPYHYEEAIEKSGVAIYNASNLEEGGPGYGTYFIANNLSNPTKFTIGPGGHCDWESVLRETGFDIFIEQRRFFDHWLKGIDNGVMEEDAVTYYTYNLQTSSIGIPGWHTAPSWPLPNQKRTAFNLSAGGLSREAVANEGQTTVTVDYDITDENFWEKGLQFTTEPLQSDVRITGHPVLRLWLSSSAADADVVARIDDIAPDGTTTYHTVEGRLRASLRKTADAPYNNLGLPYHPFTEESVQPLVPGEPVELVFDFYVISNVFKAGHKIRLTLNFADQRATPELNPAPEVTVYYGGEKDSELILPVIVAEQEKNMDTAEPAQ